MRLISSLLVSMMLVGCGKKDEEKEGDAKRILPSIAEAVDKAKPAGFAGTALRLQEESISLTATPAEAAEALRDFLSDDVSSLGGHTKAGWIDAYVYDLEQRVTEVTNETDPDCLSGEAKSIAFDGGNGHSLTLKLQCVRSFESPTDQSGAGSGLAYGRDDTHFHIYLMLAQKANANDKFGYAATVNRTTEEVDLLFMERSESWQRTKFFRLKTSPAPKSFAFSVAGTNDGVGPVSSKTAHMLSGGARFIANDTLLRAEGQAGKQTGPTGELTEAFAFDTSECFDATNLATAPATCGASAPALPASLPLVAATSMPAAKETIVASLKTMQALVAAGVGVDQPPPAPPASLR